MYISHCQSPVAAYSNSPLFLYIINSINMSFSRVSNKIIQVRLEDKDDPVLFNQVYFTGALKLLDSLTNIENAHKQLGYGYTEHVAQFRTPSISIDPSKDILYLLIEPKQFDEIIMLYACFFREAKYIAMDNILACHFIYSTLPRKSKLDELMPFNWKLFEKLTEVFVVTKADGVSMDGDECEEVLEFEKLNLPDPTFVEDIKSLQLTFTTPHVRLVRSSRPCSHPTSTRVIMGTRKADD